MLTASELFKNEISEKRLLNSVKGISNYHRIQVSPGFREAANYVYDNLTKMGIEAKILQYPANGSNWYLQNKMFLEWKLNSAYLDLCEPFMHLADSGSEPISVCQKSYPYNFEDGLEMVFMDKGTNEKDYEDVDLENKIIFCHQQFHEFDWAFEKGAKGFVTDYIAENASRTRADLYHSLTYTSFWWKHNETEVHPFGFVLSPCMGDQLEKIYYERKKAGLKTILKGKVDTELYDGIMEVVEATLPGESDEAVILSSHLCHPKSSCNDNASGCAANMEMLRVLKKLMDEGKIERNKRTIKVIFMPEFTGTYAYLTDHDYSKIVGGLNLDMVGGKQTRAYGPITLTLLPEYSPSIVQPLTHYALNLAGRETENLLGDMIPFTHYVTESYTSGSDHMLFSNPDINIPCCMLGQWPDRNYHTATDTIDVIDPAVLAFSTRTACNFAYGLANLKSADLPAIFNCLHLEMMENLNKINENLTKGKINECEVYDHIMAKKDYYLAVSESVKSLLAEVDDKTIEREKAYITTVADGFVELLNAKEEKTKITDLRKVKKLFVGPIQSITDNLLSCDEKCQQLYKSYKEKFVKGFDDSSDTIVAYCSLGMNVGQIKKACSISFLEKADEQVDAYLELLECMKMIEITNK